MTAKSRKQQIQGLLADDPKDPFLRYGLAMEYVSEGNDAEAVRCFQEMLELTPDYVPSYHQAGLALSRLGRNAEAAEVLRRGIGAARQQNNLHAAEEMQGFLASIS
jgi:tetratricopeptide (TPR) repeat protein